VERNGSRACDGSAGMACIIDKTTFSCRPTGPQEKGRRKAFSDRVSARHLSIHRHMPLTACGRKVK
jgi:hypothetical protein